MGSKTITDSHTDDSVRLPRRKVVQSRRQKLSIRAHQESRPNKRKGEYHTLSSVKMQGSSDFSSHSSSKFNKSSLVSQKKHECVEGARTVSGSLKNTTSSAVASAIKTLTTISSEIKENSIKIATVPSTVIKW